MTKHQLQALFLMQMTHGASKVYLMTQQNHPDTAQPQVSMLTHDTETGTWDELLTLLKGYHHHESKGENLWPLFVKKETV